MNRDTKIVIGVLVALAFCGVFIFNFENCNAPPSGAESAEIRTKCQRVADRAPCAQARSARRCEQAVLDDCLEDHGL